MTQLSPAEIETLRKYTDRHRIWCQVEDFSQTSECSCGVYQIRLILDRLTPTPEPEVDEATKVWREMLISAFEAVNDASMAEAHRKGILSLSKWDEAQISCLREVLARKGAERDALGAEADQLAMYLQDRDAELATLRAENERLKKLDVEYGQIETAIIFADPEFDGDSDHATCGERLIASVKRLAKAAERNPAEPEHRLSGEAVTATLEKSCAPLASRSSDGSGAIEASVNRMAARMGGKFVKNERWPEVVANHSDGSGVEVQQVDRNLEILIRDLRLFADRPVGSIRIDMRDVRSIIRLHDSAAEAEARGRREALGKALEVVADYADGFRAAYYIDPIIDELKRLMTEGK